MIVGASDMKTMVAGPPPKTRISTPADQKVGQASSPDKKKSPVMAIAAGVVILAAAGGGYAMFGGKSAANTPADTSHTSAQAATPGRDSTPPAVTPTPTPQQQQTNPLSRPATQNPPATQTNTRPNPPAGARHDQTAIQAELDATVNVVAEGSPSARRTALRRLGEIYGYTDLDDAMRADAALQAATGYTVVAEAEKTNGDPAAEKAALAAAIDWYQKSNRLAPKSRIADMIGAAQARIRELP